MNLALVETVIRWAAGLLAFSTLAVILYGVWRGTQRQVGRTVGLAGGWLRSWWFYLASSLFFFGIAYLGWNPLPLSISTSIRVTMLVAGSVLYFPGMALLLWGRLALGRNYFVSTGFGAQLFKGQQLITRGPYAVIRHPMYLGLILAALGGLLIYFTWTMVFFAGFAPLLTMRAFREEKVLAAEFGDQWRDYCRRVPMFAPRLKRKEHPHA